MKRFRSFLTFFIPFILFFVYFINNNEHNTSSASHMQHGVVEIPAGYKVPSLDIKVTPDLSGTWLLKVETTHFSFAPQRVGMKAPSYNEGHAHIFVNGKKLNRLYGEFYNLGSLKKGKNEIIVTLNSNDHGALYHSGQPIQKRIVVDN